MNFDYILRWIKRDNNIYEDETENCESNMKENLFFLLFYICIQRSFIVHTAGKLYEYQHMFVRTVVPYI